MSFDQSKSALGKQRLVEVGPDEMWTDFLEQINDLMLEEKAARQVSDHNKLAEICTRIVSNIFFILYILMAIIYRSKCLSTPMNSKNLESSCSNFAKGEVRLRSQLSRWLRSARTPCLISFQLELRNTRCSSHWERLVKVRCSLSVNTPSLPWLFASISRKTVNPKSQPKSSKKFKLKLMVLLKSRRRLNSSFIRWNWYSWGETS